MNSVQFENGNKDVWDRSTAS